MARMRALCSVPHRQGGRYRCRPFDGRARRGYDHRGQGLPHDHDLAATGCHGRDPDRGRRRRRLKTLKRVAEQAAPRKRKKPNPLKAIAYALESKLPLTLENPRTRLLGFSRVRGCRRRERGSLVEAPALLHVRWALSTCWDGYRFPPRKEMLSCLSRAASPTSEDWLGAEHPALWRGRLQCPRNRCCCWRLLEPAPPLACGGFSLRQRCADERTRLRPVRGVV